MSRIARLTADTRFVCIGETLWDVLPQGEFLGGAPFNVAAHLTRLGSPVHLVTRIGSDRRGLAAQEVFKKLSLSLSLVQMDEQLPTGIAQARLLPDGSAEYHFPAPVAFDRLAVTPNVFEACVVFGSLGQRDPVSALAIAEWLKKASYRVLDLNLRAPFDGDDIIHQSIKRADFLKLNEHEVVRLERLFDLKTSDDGLAQYLKSQFGVQALCITEGERGASLWWEGRKISQAALKVSVVDTVGAGDAFLAMLLTSLSRGLTPADALNKATRLAALVVTHAGAVPEYDPRLF